MSAEGVARFISVVALHFPRPKFGDDEIMEGAWVASMNRTLGGFSDHVLVEAADKIVSTRHPKRDGRFFPTPAECSATCVEMRNLHKATEAPLLAAPNSNEWSDERLALAFDLVHTDIGRRAAREGWVLRLYDFCRREMRLPQSDEITRCIHEAKALDRALDEYRAREPSALMNAILAWGASFERKRDEIASKVLGGKRG